MLDEGGRCREIKGFEGLKGFKGLEELSEVDGDPSLS
jgi:hypothetical protein